MNESVDPAKEKDILMWQLEDEQFFKGRLEDIIDWHR